MRSVMTTRGLAARTGAAVVVAAASLGLAACSDDTAGSEGGADVGEILDDQPVAEEPVEGELWDGLDRAFYDEMGSYIGEEVRLSAEVHEVLDPAAFSLSGDSDDSGAGGINPVDALLVVSADPDWQVTDTDTVGVTGTLRDGFSVTGVEDDLGIELDDAAFSAYENAPYVVAETVEPLS